jgi:hypothetical protein
MKTHFSLISSSHKKGEQSEESIAKLINVDFDFEGRISIEAHVMRYPQEVKDA